MPQQTLQLEEAIAAVQSASLSLREAARKFRVPRTTLQRRVQRRVSTALGSPPAAVERVVAVAPVVSGLNASSDSPRDNAVELHGTDRRDVPVVGRKRRADDSETPNSGGRGSMGRARSGSMCMHVCVCGV